MQQTIIVDDIQFVMSICSLGSSLCSVLYGQCIHWTNHICNAIRIFCIRKRLRGYGHTVRMTHSIMNIQSLYSFCPVCSACIHFVSRFGCTVTLSFMQPEWTQRCSKEKHYQILKPTRIHGNKTVTKLCGKIGYFLTIQNILMQNFEEQNALSRYSPLLLLALRKRAL